MFDDAKPEVEAIAQRLVDAVDFRADKLEDVLSAMVAAITFTMSLHCPDCRKEIARQLRKHVPAMLAESNVLAATDRPTEHRHLQ